MTHVFLSFAQRARCEAKARGAEPDECYTRGAPLRELPDLAIEVALTSGGLEKLHVYAGLGVPELWLFRNDALEIHVLRGARYERIDASALLPELDLAELMRCVRLGDQLEAVDAYRVSLGA